MTDGGILEVEVGGAEGVLVNIGNQPVEICKLYGPTSYDNVRVRIDQQKHEWVFEQGEDDEWLEVGRSPGTI